MAILTARQQLMYQNQPKAASQEFRKRGQRGCALLHLNEF
jgi:hypothetical protein